MNNPEVTASMPPGVRPALAAARVLICGAGGLGSNAAMLLARSGVGELEIFDCDVVSASNLNRQFFFADQIGRSKVEALGENLRRIGGGAELILRHVELTPGNREELLGAPCDLILECFDRSESKALLTSFVRSRRPEIPLVAVSGICGVGDGAMPVRRMAENFYLVGDGRSDVSEGTLASRVMLAAATQVQLGISMILQKTGAGNE